MKDKAALADLALFGGAPRFEVPKSTSNLVRPALENFLRYSRSFFEAPAEDAAAGPVVTALEARLAALHDARHCVSFCSGFWALVLAISALARPGRTQVVMPSLTYRRMADVVAWTGLVPHFCDVDPESLAISAATAAARLNEQTALILAVHPIVNCCDVAGLETLAREHELPLLFDAVESVYERVPGGKIGRFGDAEVFSLHASKLVNGFEGGYITTNNAALAEELRRRREGSSTEPPHGLNARLNEVHAAMALACLDDLEPQMLRNQARYEAYRDQLAGIPGIRLLEFDPRQPTSFKTIVVEFTEAWPVSRDDTVRLLNAERILARAYYAPPLHLKPMAYPSIASPLPVTEFYAGRLMLLPCGHFIEPDDIAAVTRLLAFIAAQGEAIRQRCVELAR